MLRPNLPPALPYPSLVLAILFLLAAPQTRAQVATNFIRGDFHTLTDNGAWSWFMEKRVIIDHGRLIAGSVRANGTFKDSQLPGWGNVELNVLDLKSGQERNLVLHEHLEQDDHNCPGLLILRDGRYLAAYTRHNQEPRLYFRISKNPHDPFEWGPEVEFVPPGLKGNWSGDNTTYCNPIMLSGEHDRIYLFHRGVSQDPNYLVSDDDARTWKYGGKLFDGRHGYSPYTKYAWDGNTIHFVCTDDHPRNYDNSLYYGFIRDGQVYRAAGELVGPLSTTTNTTIHPWDLTRIFQGGSNNVAWMTDMQLDAKGRPVVLFTVKKDGAGSVRGKGGMDMRFHYARWDGSHWQESEIAYAGKRLYPNEDDYTGLGAIDPQDTAVLYISTDVWPRTGKPLISAADGKRHHEIFRGTTTDSGLTWNWLPVTENSTADNLRPVVPQWEDSRTALVWMRGKYSNNRGQWDTSVVASLLHPADFLETSAH